MIGGSSRPLCTDGGAHRWQTCCVCFKYVQGVELGHTVCAVCHIELFTAGYYCDCVKVAHPDEAMPVADAAPRKSACILYLGYSSEYEAVCAPLLRLAHPHPHRGMLWVTPGGLINDGELPAHAALRETCEELLSLDDHAASQRADDLLAMVQAIYSNGGTIRLTGPYGGTYKHEAFLLTHLLGAVDDLVANFVPNREVDQIRLVPVINIDGSALCVSVGDEQLMLRDKIGYLRTLEARTVASDIASAVVATSPPCSPPVAATPPPILPSLVSNHEQQPFATQTDAGRFLAAGSPLRAAAALRMDAQLEDADARLEALESAADDIEDMQEELRILCAQCGGTGMIKGDDCLFCEGSGRDMPLDVDERLITPAPLVPSSAATTVSDYISSPSPLPSFNSDATKVALTSQRSDTERHTDTVHEAELASQASPTLAQSMPLWAKLGEPLLELLISHGLIEYSDEPSTVFSDLSMEDISKLITLSADDKSRLALLGCRSDDQLSMPPPPPHRGVERTDILDTPSARPGCVGGGPHRWQRCTICHGLVGGTDGSAICAIPGCGVMRPTKGRFCDCMEIEAHPAASPQEPRVCLSAPQVWQPHASSDVNRRASHAKTLATSAQAASPPQRYSDAASLAKSAGHFLTSAACPFPVGAAPWTLLPPPPPSDLPPRAIPDLVDHIVDNWPEPYPNEYRLPLPAGFDMDNITHWAFYEHSGQIREAWRRLGYVSASVADRPTLMPPSAGLLPLRRPSLRRRAAHRRSRPAHLCPHESRRVRP